VYRQLRVVARKLVIPNVFDEGLLSVGYTDPSEANQELGTPDVAQSACGGGSRIRPR